MLKFVCVCVRERERERDEEDRLKETLSERITRQNSVTDRLGNTS